MSSYRLSSSSSNETQESPSGTPPDGRSLEGATIVPLQLSLHKRGPVHVLVYQKLRSSKGEWVPVGNLDRVRVSDRKSGKSIRIRLSTSRTDVDLLQANLRCFERLNNGNQPWKSSSAGPDSFSEVDRQVCADSLPGELAVDIEVKIYVIYRTVKIQAIIPSTTGDFPVEAESAPFVTYNSGSEDAKKRIKTDTSAAALKQPGDDEWSILMSNLNVDGITRAKHFLQYSDIRLKTDIDDITAAIKTVSELQGRSYRWKRAVDVEPDTTLSSASTSTDGDDPSVDTPRGHRVLGFIAQELQRVVPDAVRTSSSGFLIVDYTTLVPILIEALKEQYTEVQKLPDQVELAVVETDATIQNTMQLLKETVDRLKRLEKRPKPKKPLDYVSKSSRKPQATPFCDFLCSRCCSCCAKRPLLWIFLSALISVILIGAAVGGLLAGLNPPQTQQPPPTRFPTSNFLGNPGFEDPTSNAWAGNYSYYQYGVGRRREADPAVDVARSLFDAGSFAAKMNLEITPSSPHMFLQQELNMTQIVEQCREITHTEIDMYASIWVHIGQNLPSNRTSSMQLRLFVVIESSSGQVYVSDYDEVDEYAQRTWRQLRLKIELDKRYLPRRMTLRLRNGVPGVVYVDYAAISLRGHDEDAPNAPYPAPS